MLKIPKGKTDIDKVIKSCEQYKDKLIRDCKLYFDYDCEQAEDCVQLSFDALYEALLNGAEIKNYRAYLYKVAMNQKNKALKDKMRCNEYDFETNEEKDEAINNTVSYTPDYIEDMVTDSEIEAEAIKIISSLSEWERELYTEHYLKIKHLRKLPRKQAKKRRL